MGMTVQEFWESDPHLAKVYREAYKVRRENRNFELWLQGYYIYNAFSTVIYNGFGRKRGQKAEKYLEKPIRITEPTEFEKIQEKEKAKQIVIAKLNAFKQRWDNGRH